MTAPRTEMPAPNDSVLAARDLIAAYRVAEFVTLARDGSPVGWPLTPELEGDRLDFSTGYIYPGKARNAQRDPRVAVLYSDPTSSGRTDADPLVLVQGRCDVFDSDLQANTDRYVAQHIRTGSPLAPMLRIPLLRQLLVGYLTRIWMEVTPEYEVSWSRTDAPPASLAASRPATFTPGPGIELPDQVRGWVSRYPRPPVLSFVARPVTRSGARAIRSAGVLLAALGLGFGIGAVIALDHRRREGELPMTPWGLRAFEGAIRRPRAGAVHGAWLRARWSLRHERHRRALALARSPSRRRARPRAQPGSTRVLDVGVQRLAWYAESM